MLFAVTHNMKLRLTYKELSLIIGIAVALLILLTFLMKDNVIFQLSENIDFSESFSLEKLAGKVSVFFKL